MIFIDESNTEMHVNVMALLKSAQATLKEVKLISQMACLEVYENLVRVS